MLKTDASKDGVAGMLLQKKDGDWKLVACASRRLSCAEENYSITDLEGLAVVYSVSKFRHYLLGTKFTILVDHCALYALNTKMPNSARLRRWAIALSEFEFRIEYTKGDLHKDIDCLSRAPINDPVDNYLEDRVYASRAVPVCSSNWIKSYTDDESKQYLECAENTRDSFKLINGLIYRVAQKNRYGHIHTVDELWVDTKFHPPPFERTPTIFLYNPRNTFVPGNFGPPCTLINNCMCRFLNGECS